jgi:hypothetical protein
MARAERICIRVTAQCLRVFASVCRGSQEAHIVGSRKAADAVLSQQIAESQFATGKRRNRAERCGVMVSDLQVEVIQTRQLLGG